MVDIADFSMSQFYNSPTPLVFNFDCSMSDESQQGDTQRRKSLKDSMSGKNLKIIGTQKRQDGKKTIRKVHRNSKADLLRQISRREVISSGFDMAKVNLILMPDEQSIVSGIEYIREICRDERNATALIEAGAVPRLLQLINEHMDHPILRSEILGTFISLTGNKKMIDYLYKINFYPTAIKLTETSKTETPQDGKDIIKCMSILMNLSGWDDAECRLVRAGTIKIINNLIQKCIEGYKEFASLPEEVWEVVLSLFETITMVIDSTDDSKDEEIFELVNAESLFISLIDVLNRLNLDQNTKEEQEKFEILLATCDMLFLIAPDVGFASGVFTLIFKLSSLDKKLCTQKVKELSLRVIERASYSAHIACFGECSKKNLLFIWTNGLYDMMKCNLIDDPTKMMKIQIYKTMSTFIDKDIRYGLYLCDRANKFPFWKACEDIDVRKPMDLKKAAMQVVMSALSHRELIRHFIPYLNIESLMKYLESETPDVTYTMSIFEVLSQLYRYPEGRRIYNEGTVDNFYEYLESYILDPISKILAIKCQYFMKIYFEGYVKLEDRIMD